MLKRFVSCALVALSMSLAAPSVLADSHTKGGKTTEQKVVSQWDKTFMNKAASGGMTEVELGQLAVQKGTHKAVKQFGQRMIDDHGKLNSELKTLATQKNVTLPKELSKDEKKLRDRLSKLSGTSFDDEYMRVMVDEHQKDVEAFQTAAKRANDSDLKQWAKNTAGILEDHLNQAKDIQSKLKEEKAAHARR